MGKTENIFKKMKKVFPYIKKFDSGKKDLKKIHLSPIKNISIVNYIKKNPYLFIKNKNKSSTKEL